MENRFSRIPLIIALSVSTIICIFTAQPAHAAGKNVSAQGSIAKAIKKIGQALKKSGISKLPSASDALSQNSTSSSSIYAQSYEVSPLSVSGTPPLLPAIPQVGAENVFWRQGVINAIAYGTPTQEQCQEFLSSEIDGRSGGLGACHMAEGVGHAFQTILHAETSQCYMKNFPTKANLNAGGVTLISGKLPNDDITKLFAPTGASRLVKVNTEPFEEGGPTEAIFIRVPSKSENRAAGLFYRAEMYFCPQDSSTARGYNIIQVTNAGNIAVTIGNESDPFGGGANLLTFGGKLDFSQKTIKWDVESDRTAVIDNVFDTNAFKAQFTITADNLVVLKHRADNDLGINKNYTVSHFSGSDVSSVGFLEGAFKGESEFDSNSNTFTGSAEYRDSYYASAPSNPLLAQVESFDMSTDSFFTDPSGVNVDTSLYSCTALPDVEVGMSNSNETLQESLRPCFERRLMNMEFCRNSPAIQQAMMRIRQACVQQGPGGPPDGGDGPPGSGPTPTPRPSPTGTPPR